MDKQTQLDEHEKAMTDEQPLSRKDGWYIGVFGGLALILWWMFFKWWLS